LGSDFPQFLRGSDIWVAYNETAETPGASFSDTTSELNPGVRTLIAGTIISCITNDTTAQVGVIMYCNPIIMALEILH